MEFLGGAKLDVLTTLLRGETPTEEQWIALGIELLGDIALGPIGGRLAGKVFAAGKSITAKMTSTMLGQARRVADEAGVAVTPWVRSAIETAGQSIARSTERKTKRSITADSKTAFAKAYGPRLSQEAVERLEARAAACVRAGSQRSGHPGSLPGGSSAPSIAPPRKTSGPTKPPDIDAPNGRRGSRPSPRPRRMRFAPNSKIKIGGNTYTTDGFGRPVRLQVPRLKLRPADEYNRLRKRGGRVRKEVVSEFGVDGVDHGGHILAVRFKDGANEALNIVPQHQNLNTGRYRVMENTIANELKEGSSVRAQFEILYAGDSSRPTSFVVTTWTRKADAPADKWVRESYVFRNQHRLGGDVR